jgi:hypothetical protein
LVQSLGKRLVALVLQLTAKEWRPTSGPSCGSSGTLTLAILARSLGLEIRCSAPVHQVIWTIIWPMTTSGDARSDEPSLV